MSHPYRGTPCKGIDDGSGASPREGGGAGEPASCGGVCCACCSRAYAQLDAARTLRSGVGYFTLRLLAAVGAGLLAGSLGVALALQMPGRHRGGAPGQEESPQGASLVALSRGSSAPMSMEGRFLRGSKVRNGAGAIRVVPFEVGGEVVGLQIPRGHEAPLLREVGLRPGDVIVGVDGRPLTSPEAALEGFTEAWEKGTTVIDVLRKGRRVVLVLRITDD